MMEKNYSTKTIQRELLVLTLSRIFGQVDSTLIDLIEDLIEWREIGGGEVLFKQGDHADCLYGVLSGRLRAVVTNADGSPKVIGEITQGETVGEMAIFTGEPRGASIIAVRDSVLVEVSKLAFEKIIRASPILVMNITKLIIERLNRQNNSRKTNYRIVNIALISLSDSPQISLFFDNLYAFLQTKGNCNYLSAKKINYHFQDEHIANATKAEQLSYRMLSNWLDQQEAQYDFILYKTDDLTSEWTKRALRQADEIILVADINTSPQPSHEEIHLLTEKDEISKANQSMVLLHSTHSSTIARQTNQWLAARQIKNHFHVRLNNNDDMARLTRHLTGQSVGLVLSGGGARAFAHVGIYRALIEAKIPVDIIGGTSMGAIVGGLIAKDLPPKEVARIVRKINVEGKSPTSDFNFFPFFSLVKGKRVDAILEAYFGGIDVEDLWKNFFCVSSNLTKAEAVIHNKGVLAKSIRASMSLPGIFPPVADKQGLLIDGALFNNTPVDVMLSFGVGKVISVDLNIPKRFEGESTTMPSIWQLIKSKLLGKQTQDYPSIMSIMFQATTINSDFKANQFKALSDLFFNPDVTNFGLMDWKSCDKIAQVGYEHAMQIIENQTPEKLLSFR